MPLVLVDISFWTIWETFPGCLYNSSKYFWISYMSVCPLLWLLPCWSQTYIGISPVPDEISVWIFFEIFLGCLYTGSKNAVSLLVGSFSYRNQTYIGISPVLDDISFWNFMETFPGYFWTIPKLFQISCMSVSLSINLLPYWNKANIGISPVVDKTSFWNFWRLAWNVCTQDPNNLELLVCLSVF